MLLNVKVHEVVQNIAMVFKTIDEMCRGINNIRCRTTQSSTSKDVPHQSDLALDIDTSRNHSTCTFHAVANRQKLEINR